MKYLVLAVIFLHIIASPILISALFSGDTDKGYGKITIKLFFIPIFVKSFDLNIVLRAVEKKHNESESENGDSNNKPNKSLKRYLLRVAKIFIARIRFRVVDIDGIMGSGDAAVTAVAVGSICAGYDSARAVMGFDGECNMRCEYDYERICLDSYCIISFCLADTIFALIAAAFNKPTSITVRREVYG
ncbi:MAG: hypothetical protein J1G04_04010 [Clostridiales bacterium]|nr:hypothetical protein [Clostridiales bacterium]